MIIIVCGTSSSGKSTLCHEMKSRLGDSWLSFSTDGYLGMLGDKFEGLHPDNPQVCVPNDICYAQQYADGTYEIIPGALCSKLYLTIPNVLKLLAEQDFNIIVDSFITTMDELNSYKEALENYGVLFVYLYASEATIGQREEARGDRLKGSALHWLKRFNFQEHCDVCINSEEMHMQQIIDEVFRVLRTRITLR
ncbi:Chloramphenicol phosphotransferase-like protein [Legionella steigerwaltii]|uniref:Chloramphenicol phosphotransferase-like protein n=1 Tax=Legionella steigerwaltii TaxID=460 RepID=A0A378LCX9_9GAMM|nr:AAA family ATPase [Legionella steigerwaltii]KTD75370.1 Chloramphenicol phosphotransferase-like protein [Legionella steigerwaltii]STY23728.1 Chloramphenicol phosphotransferase-like protein [Legionella steigerwaltii]